MKERSNTQETLIISLEILRCIPKNRKITAKQLHQYLEELGYHRNLRTVQRQLDTLSHHFAIERDESIKPYGYRWMNGAKEFEVPPRRDDNLESAA